MTAKAPRQVRGKLVAFNIGPRGDIEGALIATTTGIAQLNFPQDTAEDMAKGMRVGSIVEVMADEEPGTGDHPIFRATDDGARRVSAGAMRS